MFWRRHLPDKVLSFESLEKSIEKDFIKSPVNGFSCLNSFTADDRLLLSLRRETRPCCQSRG
jgi:hypothetical protein